MAWKWRSVTKTIFMVLSSVFMLALIYRGFLGWNTVFLLPAESDNIHIRPTSRNQTVDKRIYDDGDTGKITQDITGSQNVSADKVILMTYGRTGSTWFGHLFDYNPNAFYYFEPFQSLKRHLVRSKILRYPPNTFRILSSKDNILPMITQIADSFLNCRFSEVPLQILAPDPPTHMSFTDEGRHKQLTSYKTCITSGKDDASCVPLLLSACHNASIVAFKTLRMKIEMAEELLTKNPSLKVLHLVRDPRAMLLSMETTFPYYRQFEKQPVEQRPHADVKGICADMEDNIKAYIKLKSKFPDRIQDLRYEDMVQEPMAKAVEVYKFLGQPMPWVVQDWVRNSTSSNVDNGPYGTSRVDPVRTAYKWIPSIMPKFAEMIDAECKMPIQHYGYGNFFELKLKYDLPDSYRTEKLHF
ncbi:carbohydrate sulfotransferase 1 [Lingula anatina]|uniref:Carbohydrate sulfotransferase 1 n=1 Tax=Lingula anatina TaxID=7574 RepID=A0A1S3JJ70_LINAN|nr:carbohydrate sulfotransferase 1 [Lingula anatina]|eukprot:XP_013410432.1 carbohydrate sulfotransferase 1 [Lingula anatina]